jgi:transposase
MTSPDSAAYEFWMPSLEGKRDPVALAQLCHSRVKSSQDTVAKALEGDYREEHLFALKQSLESFRYYQRLIGEVNKEIESRLQGLEKSPAAEAKPPARTKSRPTNADTTNQLHSICAANYIGFLAWISPRYPASAG